MCLLKHDALFVVAQFDTDQSIVIKSDKCAFPYLPFTMLAKRFEEMKHKGVWHVSANNTNRAILNDAIRKTQKPQILEQ